MASSWQELGAAVVVVGSVVVVGITVLVVRETVAVVGGTGIVGGGLLTLLGTKVRRAMSFVGIDDGLEALKHLPQRKKKDQGSDHYFRKGVTRQQEMSLSADKDLDDYIEDGK